MFMSEKNYTKMSEKLPASSAPGIDSWDLSNALQHSLLLHHRVWLQDPRDPTNHHLLWSLSNRNWYFGIVRDNSVNNITIYLCQSALVDIVQLKSTLLA